MSAENGNFHQVSAVWSISHENIKFKEGPKHSEYINVIFVAFTQLKLLAIFDENNT